MAIEPINLNLIQTADESGRTGKTGATSKSTPTQPGADFGSTISNALGKLDEMQQTSDSAIQQLASGEDVDLHSVMIGVEQTDIAFRVALSLRDKLVEAYQEVMRMQI